MCSNFHRRDFATFLVQVTKIGACFQTYRSYSDTTQPYAGKILQEKAERSDEVRLTYFDCYIHLSCDGLHLGPHWKS